MDSGAATDGQRIPDDATRKQRIEALSCDRPGLKEVEPDILSRAYAYLARVCGEARAEPRKEEGLQTVVRIPSNEEVEMTPRDLRNALKRALKDSRLRRDLIQKLKSMLREFGSDLFYWSYRDLPPPPLILNALELMEGLDPEVEAILAWLSRRSSGVLRYAWANELFLIGWKQEDVAKIGSKWWGWWGWREWREWREWWEWRTLWKWPTKSLRYWLRWSTWFNVFPSTLHPLLAELFFQPSCAALFGLALPYFVEVELLRLVRFEFLREFATLNGEPLPRQIRGKWEEWVRTESEHEDLLRRIQESREEQRRIAEKIRTSLQREPLDRPEAPSVPQGSLSRWHELADRIWGMKREAMNYEKQLRKATRQLLRVLYRDLYRDLYRERRQERQIEFQQLWPDGVLGIYFPAERRIVIYTPMIELVGQSLKVKPEKIYRITLNHELAHAVIHLGEAEGFPNWRNFEHSPIGLHEGLAQECVRRVVPDRQTLSRIEEKLPPLYEVARLLEGMPAECLRELLESWREGKKSSSFEELRKRLQQARAIMSRSGEDSQQLFGTIQRARNLEDLNRSLEQIFQKAAHYGMQVPSDCERRRLLFQAIVEQTGAAKAGLYLRYKEIKDMIKSVPPLEHLKNSLAIPRPEESNQPMQEKARHEEPTHESRDPDH